MRSLVRFLVIFAAVGVAAAGYVQARGLRWLPDAKALHDERAKAAVRDALKAESAAILAKASISLEQLQDYLATGAIFVDARSPADFAAEHLRADIIINLPSDLVGDRDQLARLRPEIRMGLPLVLYCGSEDCDAAQLVYKALANEFATDADMYIFVPGWAGIKAAKLPASTDPESDLEALAQAAFGEAPPDATPQDTPASVEPGGE